MTTFLYISYKGHLLVCDYPSNNRMEYALNVIIGTVTITDVKL